MFKNLKVMAHSGLGQDAWRLWLGQRPAMNDNSRDNDNRQDLGALITHQALLFVLHVNQPIQSTQQEVNTNKSLHVIFAPIDR